MVGMLVTSFATFCLRLMLLVIYLKRLMRWNRWGLVFVRIFFGCLAQSGLVLLVISVDGLVRWRRRRPSEVLSSLGPP